MKLSLVLLALGVIFAPHLLAEELETTDNSRFKYLYDENTPAPLGVQYGIQVRSLATTWEREPEELWRHFGSSFSSLDEEAADALTDSLLADGQAILQDENEVYAQVACGAARPAGDAAIRAMSAANDLVKLTYEDHYIRMKARLSPTEGAELDKWLNKANEETVIMFYDYDKTVAESGLEADAYLSSYCSVKGL